MQIPVDLDRTLPRPLSDQLADQLRALLRTGRIPAGARLPSSRALAEQLDVARNTVVRAYESLAMEGVVESRAASGFYAAPPPDSVGMLRPTSLRAARPSEFGRRAMLHDFVPSRPHPDLFPVKTWRRLLQGCLSYGATAGMADAGDPGGLAGLRAAVAAHLATSRGIVADPAQILIVTGIQEGLSLVARLLAEPGSRVLMEDPCYQGAADAFGAAGAQLAGIAVDEDGILAEALPEQRTALLYLTPAHQYPTGYTLSAARRAQVVAWARRNGAYLVEDDYDGEFRYDGSPLPSLAGMAPDCTIHLGTFSTTLGAGLRLGYAVVPPRCIDAMRAAKSLLNRGNSWLEQAVLAQFLQTGSYAAHLTRCRVQYKEARDTLLAALARHFGRVEVSGDAAGLHLLWRLPAGVPEAARLEELARQQQVGVHALRSANVHEFAPTTLASRSMLLGYAALTPQQIDQGILRLSDAVDDALDDVPEFVRELLIDGLPPLRARPLRSGRQSARLFLRQKPAIRTITRSRLSDELAHEELSPMRLVRGIYRYPIKGLSPQPVRGIELEAGKPFPFDRVFALARPGVAVNPEQPEWAKKGLFLMLMLDETLARVETYVDRETLALTVWRGQQRANGATPELLLQADLKTADGRAAVEAFFRRQVARLAEKPENPRLVHAPAGHFMDKPDNVMSCINLATVRSLEAEWGVALHPLRFRANFYIEGARPWEEFDWIGSDIQLGDVLFRVDRRNGRCSATNVNPVTGERDLDIPGELRKRFGHKDLGVYLVARTDGKVVVGDHVTVPELAVSAHEAAPFVVPHAGSFICRGCYYVYVEAKGTAAVLPGTPFAAVPDDYACPDCGTGKASYRPYLDDLEAAPAAAS